MAQIMVSFAHSASDKSCHSHFDHSSKLFCLAESGTEIGSLTTRLSRLGRGCWKPVSRLMGSLTSKLFPCSEAIDFAGFGLTTISPSSLPSHSRPSATGTPPFSPVIGRVEAVEEALANFACSFRRPSKTSSNCLSALPFFSSSFFVFAVVAASAAASSLEPYP